MVKYFQLFLSYYVKSRKYYFPIYLSEAARLWPQPAFTPTITLLQSHICEKHSTTDTSLEITVSAMNLRSQMPSGTLLASVKCCGPHMQWALSRSQWPSHAVVPGKRLHRHRVTAKSMLKGNRASVRRVK
jgi:hypothetical protein